MLRESHLQLLGIKPEQLKLAHQTIKQSGQLDVYAIGTNSASTKARRILEGKGYQNIQINGAYFQKMDTDYVWTVHATYNQEKHF